MLFVYVYFIFLIYFSQVTFIWLFVFIKKKKVKTVGRSDDLWRLSYGEGGGFKKILFLSTPFKHFGVNLLQAFEHFCLVFNTIYMFKQTPTSIHDVPLAYTSPSDHVWGHWPGPWPPGTDTWCRRYNPAINYHQSLKIYSTSPNIYVNWQETRKPDQNFVKKKTWRNERKGGGWKVQHLRVWYRQRQDIYSQHLGQGVAFPSGDQ